jgi:glycosyltransferase involved in cell wall biosynthesis
LAENYKQPLIGPLRRAIIPLLRYSLWVRRMARPDKYDVMIFNQWPLAHVVFARKSGRTKIVLDWCEVRSGQFYRSLMKWLPGATGRNIAVSLAVANSVAAASGCHVEYIPSGIWPSKYRCEDRTRRSGIVYLGRVTDHKNIGLLIEAFEMMREAGYPGDLIIAGTGPALGVLTTASKSSRFSANIHFLGFVDEDTKIRLLASSEALVIPSRREGFPRVVAEGMASGLPIATVDFPDNGTKTVVRDYGIGIVAEPTAKALSVAVADVLRDWSVYSENCLKHSSELDWKILVQKLLA